jgi:TM2 domain-containing membrane protein YozV
MSGGFGRKGVMAGSPVPRAFGSAAGSAMGSNSRPAPPAANPDDGLSPQARAFLAAERARKAEGRPAPGPMTDAFAATASASAAGNRYTLSTRPERSLLLAYVYWWFCGILGAHRFYLGAYQSAAVMPVLFFGGLLVMLATPLPGVAMICICVGWNLVDAFLIPGLYRRYCAERRGADIANVFS